MGVADGRVRLTSCDHCTRYRILVRNFNAWPYRKTQSSLRTMEPRVVKRSKSSEQASPVFDRKAKVARLSEDIQRLEREITTKRFELSRLSAAYSLPDDVWHHILELAYQHRFPECHTEQYAVEGFPISMAHVSQKFRALALNLPTVWSCIHVTPRFGREDTFSPLLEAQLTYSGNRPLTILLSCHSEVFGEHTRMDSYGDSSSCWLDWGDFRRSDEFDRYHSWWTLLLEHANRWKRLTFYSLLNGFAAEFLNRTVFKPETSFESLEQLGVYVHNKDDGYSDVEDDEMAQPLSLDQVNAPSLRCLRGYNMLMLAPKPMMHQLRELVLQNMSEIMLYPALIDIINANSTTLETLIVFEVQLDELDSNSAKLQTLPRLRRLFLGAIEFPAAFSTILHTVLEASPQLLRLDIASSLSRVEQLLTPYPKGRSYPSVETVGLSFTKDSESVTKNIALQPHSFLGRFPGMKCLLVAGRNSTVTPYMRTLLDHSRNTAQAGSSLWSGLQRLVLVGDDPGPSDHYTNNALKDGVLRDFVAHRAQIGNPMRTLWLDTGDVSDDTLRILQQQLTIRNIRAEAAKIREYFLMEMWGSYQDKPVAAPWSTSAVLDVGFE